MVLTRPHCLTSDRIDDHHESLILIFYARLQFGNIYKLLILSADEIYFSVVWKIVYVPSFSSWIYLFPPLFKFFPVPSLFSGPNKNVQIPPHLNHSRKYASRRARTHDHVAHLPSLSFSLSSRRSNLADDIVFISLDPSTPSKVHGRRE